MNDGVVRTFVAFIKFRGADIVDTADTTNKSSKRLRARLLRTPKKHYEPLLTATHPKPGAKSKRKRTNKKTTRKDLGAEDNSEP